MRIDHALPMERYAAAAAHSRTAEFKQKKQIAIERIKTWDLMPRNKRYPSVFCLSHGKDSTAMVLLARLAGIDFITETTANGGDFAIQYSYMEEFNKWLGVRTHINRPEKPALEARLFYKEWGNKNGVTKPDGSPLDYFGLGKLEEVYAWDMIEQYEFDATNWEDDCIYFVASRSAEGMERMFEVKSYGIYQKNDFGEDSRPRSAIRALPIADWRDIDVWAFLVEQDAPVSPIYSFNQIPQRKGRSSFPRTLGYMDHRFLSSEYYRWMARYTPVELSNLVAAFPEVAERFTKRK